MSRAGAARTPPSQPPRRHDSAARAAKVRGAPGARRGCGPGPSASGGAAWDGGEARARAAGRRRLFPQLPPPPFPDDFWAARRGPLPAGGGSGRAARGARRGAPRVGGAGQARAGPRAGWREKAGRPRAGREPGPPGRGRGLRVARGRERLPLPRPSGVPGKKLKCRGLVGPACGELGPAGLHPGVPTWVPEDRAAEARGTRCPFPSGAGRRRETPVRSS